MMKVVHLLLKRLMPLLAAVAFLALPASAEPLCDPHEQHACAALHMEFHEHDDFGAHDPASHEHGVHSHGNCHVPMTEAKSFELSALVGRDEAVPALRDQRARSAITPALERPPRV
ncbi:MAG: hypothetical protein C0456_17000 [Hyphomonas sp.]|uniref:hypothetical protein n=1 Tax=Hyphomonas sp. TaxID=87 RepID=UPI001DEA0E43|nr:hypothetical protein [Hyphomonas sp.]MBA4228312.1 hypothetical protein [Hyphomonas sp.]